MDTSIEAMLHEVKADLEVKIKETIPSVAAKIPGTEIEDEILGLIDHQGLDPKGSIGEFALGFTGLMERQIVKLEEVITGTDTDGETDNIELTPEAALTFIKHFDIFNDFLTRVEKLLDIPVDAQDAVAPLQSENVLAFTVACKQILKCEQALKPVPVAVERDTTNDED